MAAGVPGGPLPPCPPPSDASLKQAMGGSEAMDSSVRSTPKLISAGLSAARHHLAFDDESRQSEIDRVPVIGAPPRPRNRNGSSFIGSRFRVSGFQVIILVIILLMMLGVFLYGVVSLAKVSDYENQTTELQEIKETYRKTLEESKGLRVVVETCRGETGELRGALHTAVTEQEKLQEVVDTSEYESFELVLGLVSIVSLMIGFVLGRKTSPEVINTTHTHISPVEQPGSLDPPPETFAQNELAEVFSATGWIPCTVLKATSNSTVVLTSDGISITLKPGDTCIRKKLTCTKCKSLTMELADLTRTLSDLQFENNRLPDLETAARQHSNDIYELESKIKTLEASLRRSEDGRTIAMRENKQLRDDYHSLQTKREEEDMRITEDLVSLASRDLDAKLTREKRRRQELEDHYKSLCLTCNSLKAELVSADEQSRETERRCAAATSKFLSAVTVGRNTHQRRI